MGHYHEEVEALGKDKEEALSEAISQYLYENGHRCDYRGCDSAEFIGRFPPKKWEQYIDETYGTALGWVNDNDAPKDNWQEKWKFVLHFHC